MHLPTKPAISLPDEPFGVKLLRREHDLQAHGRSKIALGDVTSCKIKLYVREGPPLSGSDRYIEEVAVLGRRVAWTSGTRVRKLFTLGSEVLQATWARFVGYSDDPVLCLLTAGCLTTCTLGGELQECTVLPDLDAVWPAGDVGLLLGGSSASTLYLLRHPLEEPQPVVADVSWRAGRQGSYAGWSGEQVVWSSDELPYVATYSEGAGRLAVWVISRAPLTPELLGDLPDIPAATPLPGPADAASIGPMTNPSGLPNGMPGTIAGAGLARTPMSRVSMFSFQPLGGSAMSGAGAVGGAVPAAAGGGTGWGGAAAGPAGLTLGGGLGGGPVLATPAQQQVSAGPAFAFPLTQHQQQQLQRQQQAAAITPCPPSTAGSDMSMAMSPASAGPQTGPGCPPSAAPSDMSMAITPAGPGAAQHVQRPGQDPSPYPPPSAAPSDMSMAITPAGAGPTQLFFQMGPQPSPCPPPSAAPSDMSMAITPAVQPMPQHFPNAPIMGQPHQAQAAPQPHQPAQPSPRPASLGPSGIPMAGTTPLPTGMNAAARRVPAGFPGARLGASGSGTAGSPFLGHGAVTPGLGTSAWGAPVASPGPGVGGGSSAIPGSALKRAPAARTPDGFLSPHLFSAKPRAETANAAGGIAASPLGPNPHTRRGQSHRAVGVPAPQLFAGEAAGGAGGGLVAPGLGGPAASPSPLPAGAATPGTLPTALTAGPWVSPVVQSGECCVMVLLHEEVLQQGWRPTEAVLATDVAGFPLLCVLCGPQSRLMAFSIAPATGPGTAAAGPHPTPATSWGPVSLHSGLAGSATPRLRVALAGTLEAKAMAAVQATRMRTGGAPGSLQTHRDLLVLLPSGELVLHRGLAPLFAVSVGPASTAAVALQTGSGRGTMPVSPPLRQLHATPASAAMAAPSGAVEPRLVGGPAAAAAGTGGRVAAADAEPQTPASAAGTDMMLDEDSDMDQASGGEEPDEHAAGGPPAAAPSCAHTAAPACTAQAGAHAGAVDDGDAPSDSDDMMVISSPPLISGPDSAVAAWRAAAGPGEVAASTDASTRAAGSTHRRTPAASAARASAGGASLPGASLDVAPAVLGLCRGVGNTVALVLAPSASAPAVGDACISGYQPAASPSTCTAKGRELRVLLPFATISPLAALVLEVVHATAPADLFVTLLRRFYGRRQACTALPTGEWAAVAAVLLEWAEDPAAFADAARQQVQSQSQSQQQEQRSGRVGAGASSSATGFSGGDGVGGRGYGLNPPPTPFSTPLHTRRFAAMSLASPLHPPRAPGPVSQSQVPPGPQTLPLQLPPHHEAEQRHRRPGHGAPSDSAPAARNTGPHSQGFTAWERMLGSSIQSQLFSGRRRPAWMVPNMPRPDAVSNPDAGKSISAASTDGASGNPLQSVQALLGPMGATVSGGRGPTAPASGAAENVAASVPATRPAPPLGAAAHPLLAVLYGLHGLYEELKLDVLSWPLLEPLAVTLAGLASGLGLHPYWEHYARDVGPSVLLVAGALEPPLLGPQGLALRPPADIHRVLSRMVCGNAPDPSELPSLLDRHGGAAAQLAGSGAACGPMPSHPVLPLTSQLLACYAVLCDCAKSCAVIMLESCLQAPAGAADLGTAAASPAAALSLEAAVRAASEQVVSLIAVQGWDAGSLGRLPPGVALPLREAFQRCRASPPAGWPIQAYALIGREDIAATLAPSGLTTGGPNAAAAAAADRRQQDRQHREQQPPGSGVTCNGAAGEPSAAPLGLGSVFRGLSGLRTPTPDTAPGESVTPTATLPTAGGAAVTAAAAAAGGSTHVDGRGSEPGSGVAGVGAGAGSGASPASSLFSFRQLPHFSLASVTPTTGTIATPYGSFLSFCTGGPGGAAGVGATGGQPTRGGVPFGGQTVGPAICNAQLSSSATGEAAAAAVAPPRPLPSHLWHLWRPPYTARLHLPSHQLDLGAELEAPRKLEGAAKQFESKHGMEGLTRGVSRLRFGRDSRLRDVITALDSSHPLLLDGLELHESDPEAPTKQQQQLLAAALRTMSLPLGRGAVALATGRPIPTEPTASVPSMCLAGLVPDSLAGHTVVNLDLSTAQPAPGGGAAADFTAWPEFHNGAAEGLRLSSGGAESLTRGSLLVATKPDIPSYTHAGLLMALGLTGHLARLSWTDMYRYLSDEHDPTTIAVLVGMAAQRRASMDPTVTKMLFLHLPARHPTTFPELELSPLVQAAALMGVGLLYEGSAHRVMAETLVEEIGRRPLNPAAAAALAADSQGGGGRRAGAAGSGLGAGGLGGGASVPPGASPLAVTHDREAYALAAGLALGMVVLGLGGSRAAAGLADLQLEERLTYYMLGSTDASAAARRAGGAFGAAGTSLFYAGGSSGLDRVFGPGTGGAKLGHAAALWGGDAAGPAALGAPTAGRSGEGPGGPAGNGQGVASVVLEPDNMLNLSITSPAATVALALMYLRTNNATIAARFQLPDTPFGLDCVRPDCITLRALGRALVMWNAVEPSAQWLADSMPPLFRGPLERLVDRVVALQQTAAAAAPAGQQGGTALPAGAGPGSRVRGAGGGRADVHAVALAHVSALSGLCLAMGLKYAGSANSRAYETLRSVALSLLAAKRRVPEVAPSSTATGGAAVVTGAGQVAGGGPTAVGRLDRAPLEASLSVVALALSVVMAGTGHLPTFHLLQALSNRRHPTHHHVVHGLGVGYGAHCAVSLALGFLFLGAGTHTFSTSNSAVAALLVSLFPTLPHTPTDNRCHLQVFRHLYVLATRRRCLEAVDIDSQQLVYVPLQVTVQPPKVEVASGMQQQQQQQPPQQQVQGALRQAGQRTGQARAASGAGGGGSGAEGTSDPMAEDAVLRTSTKANLPWTPDGQMRPGGGIGGVSMPLELNTTPLMATPLTATGTTLSGLAGAPAVAAGTGISGGGAGSPPMLEALHLEGDSPGTGPQARRGTGGGATGVVGLTTAAAKSAGGPPAGPALSAVRSAPLTNSGQAGDAAQGSDQSRGAGLPGTHTGPGQQGQAPAPIAQAETFPALTYERVAPALLPEPHQLVSLAVRGPRYWPQRLDWSCRGYSGDAIAETPGASGGGATAASAVSVATGRGQPAEPPGPYGTPYGHFPFATPMPGGGGGGSGAMWAAQRPSLLAMTPGAMPLQVPLAPGCQGPHARAGVSGVMLGRPDISGGGAAGAGLAGGSSGIGGGSALETVYRQLLLFVKKRAGSLSYSQDPSGIRSLLSRAFHNQSLLRTPLDLSVSYNRHRAAAAAAAAAGATPLPPPGGNGRARRQLDWHTASPSDGSPLPGDSGPVSPLEGSGKPPAGRASRGGAGMESLTLTPGPGSASAAPRQTSNTGSPADGGAVDDGGGSGAAEYGCGFDIVYLCATFSVDPSIMGFAQHTQAMRDLWLAVEAEATAEARGNGGAADGASGKAGETGFRSGLRRGLVQLAPGGHAGRAAGGKALATRVAGAATAGCSSEGGAAAGQWQQQQRRRHGADLLSFCYSALYECINGEKPTALAMYLHLHCLVDRAATAAAATTVDDGSYGCGFPAALPLPLAAMVEEPRYALRGSGTGNHLTRSVYCGRSLAPGARAPLTTALRGLQLARAYYGGPLAAAVAAAGASPDVLVDADEQALWRPLLQPAFLDSLWCMLQQRCWRPLGLLPQPGVIFPGGAGPVAAPALGSTPASSASRSALEVALRRGRLTDIQDVEQLGTGAARRVIHAKVQDSLAHCMALHQLPPLATLATALAQLRALPAWSKLQQVAAAAAAGGNAGPAGAAGPAGSGSVTPSWAVLPLLSLVLPGLPQEALLLIAAAMPI